MTRYDDDQAVIDTEIDARRLPVTNREDDRRQTAWEHGRECQR